MAHEVSFTFTVTQDGEPFFEGSGKWANVPREDVVVMEGIVQEAAAKLQALGQSKLPGGKRK